MRATSRRSTISTRPMPSNERLLQTSYSLSWRVAEIRPLLSKLRIDVSQFHSCIQYRFPASHQRAYGMLTMSSQFGPVPLVTWTSRGVKPPSYATTPDSYPTTLHFCLHVTLTPALGTDEAPDPAEGLDPKVVEVYTKYVTSLRFALVRKKGKPARLTTYKQTPESASSCEATARARFLSRSKSSLRSRHGLASSRSHHPSSGHRRLRTRPLGSSSRT